MVIIFYGTSAELIKLLGLVKGIKREDQYLICTAQQRQQLDQFHKQSQIEPDIYLAHGWNGRDVHNISEMVGFMFKVHINFLLKYTLIKKKYKELDTQRNTKSIALVHGDTLTTVVGAYMGRLLGLPVGHIEAGLRSGKLFHPFPEELDRRIVSKIARHHFSPNEVAVGNLKRESTRGKIINTIYNTSKDSIDLADTYKSDALKKHTIPHSFGLISIHRTELLERKRELEEFLKAINECALGGKEFVFVDHSTTKEKIKLLGFDHYLDVPTIHRIPKLAYMDFIQVVKKSSFIVTDSGGLQEDAYFLGVPTLIHRLATERNEGLGSNVSLSHLNIGVLKKFIDQQRVDVEKKSIKNEVSPSRIVIDYLRSNSFIR